jgi:regulator of replication initiation timing
MSEHASDYSLSPKDLIKEPRALLRENNELREQVAELIRQLGARQAQLDAMVESRHKLREQVKQLREACELGLRHFKPRPEQRQTLKPWPEMLAVYDQVCGVFEAALADTEPKAAP